VSPGLPTIRTDPGKLRIVVRNLLSNAVKFTERGAVTLEARRDDGAVVIAVADTGIGIDDESQRRIFEAFYQADAVRGSSGGVGLGLHIVQQLVALLGGDLTVSSRVGVGSRFTMRLPLEAPVGTPH
jgi:signal transduction histidine kinase